MAISKPLYDYTVKYLEEHKLVSSKSLAVAYYKLGKNEKTNGRSYIFTRILKELEQKGVIENFNGNNWMRIENSNSAGV